MTDDAFWPWVLGLAGTVILGLFALLKAVWFKAIASENREQKEFRDRVEADLKKIHDTVKDVKHGLDKRVTLLEDHERRRKYEEDRRPEGGAI